jgi:hypothetical protein
MVVNFRTRGISRGTHKLARTPTLIKKKKKKKKMASLKIIIVKVAEYRLNESFIKVKEDVK